MRVQMRMNYEMNRQPQSDSDSSLADYPVLNALTEAPEGRLRVCADRALEKHQRHPRSQQLATADAELVGPPRGAGGGNPTTRSQLTARLYMIYHLNAARVSHPHLGQGRKRWSWI